MLKPNYQRLARRLFKDESIRLKLYTDTVGKISIGIGRNLTDNGIRPNEALYLFRNDLQTAEDELFRAYPWAIGLDQVRQEVLINMSFNMGVTTLNQFINTLNYVKLGNYRQAANGMRNSKWHKQVGNRAERLALMMESGMAIE